MKLSPAAASLMRTCPGGGSGSATSSSFSVSGPPAARIRIAFIVVAAIALARAAYHRYGIVPPMGETLKTADIAALAKDAGASKAARFGAMADTLRGSEILRIANEIRALAADGKPLVDLTVGDFS